ncbi:hypothetical protein Rsub_05625 [Raphidocelis subcapitata]|uniref:RRM domain-containing protein n=1 Tax=Raphidocelis subcapitata TaxID=307507 RepID=A0A2V0NZF8_9CHLO|nr:hypothetical protein Rsub_05625 [Raphidocelis subcapitata]|eukprot:GBF93014.1 hypothetical protein Rsub_05625 [Raphidocelis subcapitata]
MPQSARGWAPGQAGWRYFGNLHACVTVAALQDVCAYFGPVEQVKVIKDKASGVSAGYGFVRFADRRCALVALQYLNNKVLFGQELRVNWAFQSHQREDTSNHWHVFDVTDAVLYASFSQLAGCSDARVMWDHATGRSKGYGFVAMRSKEEAQAAIERMHGQVVGTRRVRCGWAQHKHDDSAALTDPGAIDVSDPANTNVYVGNIAPDWSEADVSAYFSSFGPTLEMKLHKKGGYGFVRYQNHADAVQAIAATNTRVMYGRAVKCCWGKNAGGARPRGGGPSGQPFGRAAPRGGGGAAAAAIAAAAAAAAAPQYAAAAGMQLFTGAGAGPGAMYGLVPGAAGGGPGGLGPLSAVLMPAGPGGVMAAGPGPGGGGGGGPQFARVLPPGAVVQGGGGGLGLVAPGDASGFMAGGFVAGAQGQIMAGPHGIAMQGAQMLQQQPGIIYMGPPAQQQQHAAMALGMQPGLAAGPQQQQQQQQQPQQQGAPLFYSAQPGGGGGPEAGGAGAPIYYAQ